MPSTILVLATIGLVLSIYALYVEWRATRSKKYKAICDFRKNVSSTKAFTSRYGRIARLPNAFYGVLYYGVVALLSFLESPLTFYLSLLSVVASVGLVFALYKLKDWCVVCIAGILLNVAILAIQL